MSDAREDGFTLVEVLVAMTILAISLSVLLDLFSNGLDLAHQTEADATASGLAQSLLDELGGTVPLHEGDAAGRFDDRYSWQMHAEPYGGADDRQAWFGNPLLVTIRVRWQDGTEERSRSLTTIRFSPEPPQ